MIRRTREHPMVVILNPNSFYWEEESGVVENNLKNCLLRGLGVPLPQILRLENRIETQNDKRQDFLDSPDRQDLLLKTEQVIRYEKSNPCITQR